MTAVRTGSPRRAVLFLVAALALVGSGLSVRRYSELAASATRAVATMLREGVERGYGVSIAYDSARPSLLRTLVLRGVRVSSTDGRARAEADRVELRFDLAGFLLRGEAVLEGVLVDGLDCSLDRDGGLDSIASIVGKIREAVSRSPGGPAKPSSDLTVTVRNARAELEVGALTVSLAMPYGDAALRDGALSVSARAAVKAYTGSGSAPAFAAELPVSLSGDIKEDFSEARLNVRTAFDSGTVGVKEQGFVVLARGGSVELRKMRDGTPLDFTVSYDTAARRAVADFAFERFKPSTIVRVSRADRVVRRFVDSTYSGKIRVDTDGSADGTKIALGFESVVAVPELEDTFAYSLEASLERGVASLDRFVASSPRGSLSVGGTVSLADRAVDLALAVDYGTASMPNRLETELRLFGRDSEYYVFGDRIRFGDAVYGPLTLEAGLSGSSVSFRLDAGILRQGAVGGEDEAAATELAGIALEGILDLQGPSILVDANVEPVTLGELGLGALLPAESPYRSALEGATVSGKASFASDFRDFSYNTRNLVIAAGGDGSAYAVVTANGTSETLSVGEFFVSAFGRNVAGSGHAVFGPDSADFSVDATLDGIAHRLRGYVAGGSVSVEGDYGFSLSASSDGGALVASARADALPVDALGEVLLLAFDLDARFADPGDWDLAFRDCAIRSAKGDASVIPEISFSGTADDSSLAIDDLAVRDRHSSLAGTLSADWDIRAEGGSAVSCAVELASAAGERYRADATLSPDAVEAFVDFRNAAVARLSAGSVSGLGSGTVRISGKPDAPRVDFDFGVKDGAWVGLPVSLSIKGAYTGSTLTLSGSTARLGGFLLDGFGASLDVASGALRLSSIFSAKTGRRSIDSWFELEGLCAFETIPGRNGVSLASLGLSGRIENLAAERGAFAPLSLSFEDGLFSMEAGHGRELVASLGADGSVAARLADTLPVSFDAKGYVRPDAVSLRFDSVRLDLGTVGAHLSIPVIAIDGGLCEGWLAVEGNPRDPDFSGSLSITDGFMTVPDYALDRIGPVGADVVVSEKTFTISDDDIPVGKDGRVAARFDAALERWSLERFDVSVKSVEGTLVRGRTGIIPWLDVTGLCSLDLGISWLDRTLSVTGAFFVPNAEVLIRPEPVKAASGPNLFDFRVDVTARTGKNVEVFFPSKEFPVILGQTDPSSSVRFHGDSSLGEYFLDGNVAMRGGELFYLQRNFFIKDATIKFAENKDKFDPRVSLKAELRTRNENGPVTIFVSAENSSLIDLNPTISSSPTLSTAEIAAMMGQDFLAMREDGSINVVSAMLNASEFLPQLNFVRVFERNVKDALGLDLFYVKTQVLQRWLLDASNIGVDAYPDATLEDYFDQTAIYAGKYVGDDVFVEGVLFLQKNPLEQQGGLTIQSELGFEWSTPLFTLDWRMRPEHPDTLFLSDQTFSFYWKFSF